MGMLSVHVDKVVYKHPKHIQSTICVFSLQYIVIIL